MPGEHHVSAVRIGDSGTTVRGRYGSSGRFLVLERRDHSFDVGHKLGLEDGRLRRYRSSHSLFRKAQDMVGPEGITYREYNGLDIKNFRKGYSKGYSNGLHLGRTAQQRTMVEVLATSSSINTDDDQVVYNVRGKY